MLPYVKPGEKPDYLQGALLLVDKPMGWTSFDVVNKIRGTLRAITGKKNIKVGHAGTLDPMATGLLVVCTGGWTKKLHELQGLDKQYLAEITLGTSTNTYDAEGEITSVGTVPEISQQALELQLAPFTGEYEQYPPAFSAIKKDGKPLYALARAGKEVVTEPRRVVVRMLQVVRFEPPFIGLDIHCGSGFYVRSLAHDLGAALGCGAHLSGLRRTAIGPYSIDDARSVAEWVDMIRAMAE